MRAIEAVTTPGETAALCQSVGVSRASLYRRRRPAPRSTPPRPRAPSSRALGATERQAVLDVLHSERFIVIDTRLDQMATAQPLTTDPAIVDTLSLAVQTYATQLRSLLEAIDTFEGQIAAVFAAHPDHELFASFPGAGAVCAPRLAAAFGTDRTRWAAASELQAHAGIAPVTERSGKALWVHHRLACPKFLKQTFHNTRTSRSASPRGPDATTISNAAGATTIMPPCDRSPSNGCGFSFAVGRTGHRTTKPHTSTRYADTGRHSSKMWLDGTTQMSMPPLPIVAVTL